MSNKIRIKKRHHATALLILNKLAKQALAGDTNAANIYLRKILPDLKAVEADINIKVDKPFCIVLDGTDTKE